jgi:vacuolar-type H+-ATPase subunit I/STV1
MEQEEVELMNKVLSGEVVEELPKEEVAMVEEPKVEDFNPESPKEEPKSDEPKETIEKEIPTEEEQKKEDPVPEDKDKVITDLKAEIEVLKAAQEKPKVEEVKKEDSPIAPTFEEQDFLKDKDLDELTRDPKEFNKVLNEIYKKASIDAGERLLKSIPEIVKSQVVIHQQLIELANNFYSANPDLVKYKKNVALVFEDLQSKNPDKSFSDLSAEAAQETRKKLNLPNPEIKEVKKLDPPPILPTKSGQAGRPSSQPSTQKIQDDLAAMNKALGKE